MGFKEKSQSKQYLKEFKANQSFLDVKIAYILFFQHHSPVIAGSSPLRENWSFKIIPVYLSQNFFLVSVYGINRDISCAQ